MRAHAIPYAFAAVLAVPGIVSMTRAQSHDPMISGLGLGADVRACAQAPQCVSSLLEVRSHITAEEALALADARAAFGQREAARRLRLDALEELFELVQARVAEGDRPGRCYILRVMASAAAHLPNNLRASMQRHIGATCPSATP